MTRWSRLGVALLVPAVLIGGCGGGSRELPPHPDIEDARDARGADPCRLLAPDQLTGLGLRPAGTAGRATEGPRCEWGGGSGVSLAVSLYTDDGGLAKLAENSEPTTTRVRVAGYPALETFTGAGEFCQYDVGVADDQVVMAALNAPASDACTSLQALLPTVVRNLPQHGG